MHYGLQWRHIHTISYNDAFQRCTPLTDAPVNGVRRWNYAFNRKYCSFADWQRVYVLVFLRLRRWLYDQSVYWSYSDPYVIFSQSNQTVFDKHDCMYVQRRRSPWTHEAIFLSLPTQPLVFHLSRHTLSFTLPLPPRPYTSFTIHFKAGFQKLCPCFFLNFTQ